jgi:RsiW-degrading membrane proteinase PrsW (M82 family)
VFFYSADRLFDMIFKSVIGSTAVDLATVDLATVDLADVVFRDLVPKLLLAILEIALDLYFHKIILKRIFFKEYKYITITPKFEKISNSFNVKLYIKINLIGIGILVCALLLYYAVFADKTLIYEISKAPVPFDETLRLCLWGALIFFIVVRLLLIRGVVIKNAEIAYKDC